MDHLSRDERRRATCSHTDAPAAARVTVTIRCPPSSQHLMLASQRFFVQIFHFSFDCQEDHKGVLTIGRPTPKLHPGWVIGRDPSKL